MLGWIGSRGAATLDRPPGRERLAGLAPVVSERSARRRARAWRVGSWCRGIAESAGRHPVAVVVWVFVSGVIAGVVTEPIAGAFYLGAAALSLAVIVAAARDHDRAVRQRLDGRSGPRGAAVELVDHVGDYGADGAVLGSWLR